MWFLLNITLSELSGDIKLWAPVIIFVIDPCSVKFSTNYYLLFACNFTAVAHVYIYSRARELIYIAKQTGTENTIITLAGLL